MQHELDTCRPVYVGEHASEHRSQRGLHEGLAAFDHRDPLAHRDRRGCGLAADEAAAEHDHLLDGGKPVTDLQSVAERSQGEHTIAVDAGDGAGPDAGGQQDSRITQRLTGRQLEGLPDRVEGVGPDPQQDLHVVVGVPVLRLHVRRLRRRRRDEELLGQRRTLVWQHLVDADDDDLSVEAVRPEAGCCRGSSHSAADDDVALPGHPASTRIMPSSPTSHG